MIPDIVVAIIVIVYIFVFVVSGIVVTEGEGGSMFLDNSCVFTVFVLYLLCLYYILCFYFIYCVCIVFIVFIVVTYGGGVNDPRQQLCRISHRQFAWP